MTPFDSAHYIDTGPDRDCAVMVRLESGAEVPAYFFTRLVGGFSPQLGKVTHWRKIYESDCVRFRAIAVMPAKDVVEA